MAVDALDVEGQQEQAFTGQDLGNFGAELVTRATRMYKGEPIDSLEFGNDALAQGLGPSVLEGLRKTFRQITAGASEDWVDRAFTLAIGVTPFGDTAALDSHVKGVQGLRELMALSGEQVLQVSPADMKQVGEIVGSVIAHHAANNRKLGELKPDKGVLGKSRLKFLATSRPRLQLLDTILSGLSRPPGAAPAA